MTQMNHNHLNKLIQIQYIEQGILELSNFFLSKNKKKHITDHK